MERQELFFSLLDKEFSKDDFKYVRSAKSFIKKSNGNNFVISFDTWPYFYMIELNAYMLIGEVEKIKKKAWGKLYNKFVTIGNTKTYLLNEKKSAVIKTETERDVLEASKIEVDFYNSFIKNYFEKYSDVFFLDKLLNTEPGKNLDIAYNEIHSSFLAIIVGKLTSNPKLPFLFEYYRNVIIKFNSAFIKQYDLLVLELNNKE